MKDRAMALVVSARLIKAHADTLAKMGNAYATRMHTFAAIIEEEAAQAAIDLARDVPALKSASMGDNVVMFPKRITRH